MFVRKSSIEPLVGIVEIALRRDGLLTEEPAELDQVTNGALGELLALFGGSEQRIALHATVRNAAPAIHHVNGTRTEEVVVDELIDAGRRFTRRHLILLH